MVAVRLLPETKAGSVRYAMPPVVPRPVRTTGMPAKTATPSAAFFIGSAIPKGDIPSHEAREREPREVGVDPGEDLDLLLGDGRVVGAGARRRVPAVLGDRDVRHGRGYQPVGVLGPDLGPGHAAAEAPHDAGHGPGQHREAHLGTVGVPAGGQVGELGRAVAAEVGDDSPVATGDLVTARTGVDLGHVPGRVDEFVDDDAGTDAVLAPFVQGDPGGDELDAVHHVAVAVGAQRLVATLRGVSDERHLGVDEESEPVQGLVDGRASLQPLRAGELARAEDLLDVIGGQGQVREARLGLEVVGVVDEEVPSQALGSGTRGVPARGCRAEELEVGDGTQLHGTAVVGEAEPLDLLVEAPGVRVEGLPCSGRIRVRGCRGLLPGGAVRLPCHVGKGVEAVGGVEFDDVDRLGVAGRPLGVEGAVRVEPAVGRGVQAGGVLFERVGAEGLDVQRRGRREALGAQGVEAAGPERQAVTCACLVGRDEVRGVQDRRGRAGEDGDPGARDAGRPHVARHSGLRCSTVMSWSSESRRATSDR